MDEGRPPLLGALAGAPIGALAGTLDAGFTVLSIGIIALNASLKSASVQPPLANKLTRMSSRVLPFSNSDFMKEINSGVVILFYFRILLQQASELHRHLLNRKILFY